MAITHKCDLTDNVGEKDVGNEDDDGNATPNQILTSCD